VPDILVTGGGNGGALEGLAAAAMGFLNTNGGNGKHPGLTGGSGMPPSATGSAANSTALESASKGPPDSTPRKK